MTNGQQKYAGKNEKRYSQQADSSAIRSYKSPKLSIGLATSHVHAEAADLYPDDNLR